MLACCVRTPHETQRVVNAGTPTSQPVSPVADYVPPAPALHVAKHDAALTALSAGDRPRGSCRTAVALAAAILTAVLPKRWRAIWPCWNPS